MGIAVFAANLGANHEQAAVLIFHDIFRLKGPGVAGPAGAGNKFVPGAEKRLARNDIDIDPGFFIVPVFIFIGPFGPVTLGYFVLQRRQFLAQDFLVGLGILRLARSVNGGLFFIAQGLL